MTKEQIFDEVRRLPASDQMEVLQRIVEIVAPPLTTEQEQGLVEAIDEADSGAMAEGPEVFGRQRDKLLGRR